VSASQSSDPKRPTFVHWLRASGQLDAGELGALVKEWNQIKHGSAGHEVFTTNPITWDQFVGSKYPRKVVTYQAYLRVTGAAPTLNKE